MEVFIVSNITDLFRFSGRNASNNVLDEQGVIAGAWFADVHEQAADKQIYLKALRNCLCILENSCVCFFLLLLYISTIIKG